MKRFLRTWSADRAHNIAERPFWERVVPGWQVRWWNEWWGKGRSCSAGGYSVQQKRSIWRCIWVFREVEGRWRYGGRWLKRDGGDGVEECESTPMARVMVSG
jgi:hypothetical protein